MKIDNIAKILMKSLEDACGLTAYKKTLDIEKINSPEYQKNFTYYYKVRRDKVWLNQFYNYMNVIKHREDIAFSDILKKLSSWEHKVRKSNKNPNGFAATNEVSFASKLLTTINPNYPIWDSQVVSALGIKVENNSIDAYIKAYQNLTDKITEIINSADGQKAIELFDKQFPNYIWVSKYKKIDFYLWNIGKK